MTYEELSVALSSLSKRNGTVPYSAIKEWNECVQRSYAQHEITQEQRNYFLDVMLDNFFHK